jgi:deazaflavin-dependent oxidoreductase (nitroreductase family)
MSLVSDLSYDIPRANWFQRAMKAFAGTRPGAWLFSKLLRHLDDLTQRLTRGRTTVPELLAGLPVLDLTTTGRRSGRPRTSHLISIPLDGSLAVLGTNFGQPATPAWVLNLEADPTATVRYRDRTVPVVARAATDAEFARVLAASGPVYPGYRKYQQRIAGQRRLRIFVLEPAQPAGGGSA